jgi:hypothetical protein
VTSRRLDPFKTLRHLYHYGEGAEKLNGLIEKFNAGDLTAAGVLATVGRRAFGLDEVNPDDGSGYPDAAVLSAVEAFAEYVAGKGSGAGNWRTYVRSTASPASSAPKNCLDCP